MNFEKQLETVVVAGGRGRRMGELTKEKPKPLLEVEGKPILTHVFDNVIEAFGSAKIILATGYRGDDIKSLYGNRYRNLNIDYVHDPRQLEIRKRLLSVKEKISTSFLFLATDVICKPDALLKVVETQEQENENLFGTISGAEDHQPALTHAIIKTKNDNAVDLEFPPSDTWEEGDLRDIHVACYRPEFIGLLNTVPDNFTSITQVISKALKDGKDFKVSKYCNPWYHFATPKDLQTQLDRS